MWTANAALVSLVFVLFNTWFTANAGCTKERAAVRKEWAALTSTERTDYINALHCLAEKPPIYDQQEYPGVRNRWDDFVALCNYASPILRRYLTNIVHISTTRFIPTSAGFFYHGIASLYTCGKRPYEKNVDTRDISHIYWDWVSNSLDLAGSPHFDGSDTSLSGDGVYDENVDRATELPKGTRGGCVKDGPLKKHTVNMGPFYNVTFGEFPDNAFNYNPHCLKRDLNPRVAAYCNSPDTITALLAASDIVEFQGIMTNGLEQAHLNGPHGCGHASVGSTMDDVYSSVADPAFFLHHANVDRMWTLWQEKDVKTRRRALNGTASLFNAPDTPEVTLETMMHYGELDRALAIREVMSPLEGGFCYRYE